MFMFMLAVLQQGSPDIFDSDVYVYLCWLFVVDFYNTSVFKKDVDVLIRGQGPGSGLVVNMGES